MGRLMIMRGQQSTGQEMCAGHYHMGHQLQGEVHWSPSLSHLAGAESAKV